MSVLMINLFYEMRIRNITQKHLSGCLNKSEKTIGNKLSGKTDFTREEMLAIQKLMPDCSLDYLFGENNPQAS
ncbi:MAG: helix-turn-helix transcriptional regulator [Clostridiales bacterium]